MHLYILHVLYYTYILLTFCSFPFITPQTNLNCQPHLSDQGNSSHLLSVGLAHYKDPCSSQVSGQIGLCVQEWADFCLPTLSEFWDCPQPSVPNHGFCFYAPFSVSVWTFFFNFCTGFIVCAVLNFTCRPFLLYHPVSAANYIVNITVYICEIFIYFFY